MVQRCVPSCFSPLLKLLSDTARFTPLSDTECYSSLTPQALLPSLPSLTPTANGRTLEEQQEEFEKLDVRRPSSETDVNGQDPAGHHYYEFMLLVRKTAAEYLALLVHEIKERGQQNHIVLTAFEPVLNLPWWKEYQLKVEEAHAVGMAPRPCTPNMDLVNREFGAVASSLSKVRACIPSMTHLSYPDPTF